MSVRHQIASRTPGFVLAPRFGGRVVLPAGQAAGDAATFLSNARLTCQTWSGYTDAQKANVVAMLKFGNPTMTSDPQVLAFAAIVNAYCADPRTATALGVGCADWAGMDAATKASTVAGWYSARGYAPDSSRISTVVSTVDGSCVDPNGLTMAATNIAPSCATWNAFTLQEKRNRVSALASASGWSFSTYDVQLGVQAIDADCLHQGIASLCDPPNPPLSNNADIDAWNAAHPNCGPIQRILGPSLNSQYGNRGGSVGGGGPQPQPQPQPQPPQPPALVPASASTTPWTTIAIVGSIALVLGYFIFKGSGSEAAAASTEPATEAGL